MTKGSDQKVSDPGMEKTPGNPFQLFMSLPWVKRWRMPVSILVIIVAAVFAIWATLPDRLKEEVLSGRFWDSSPKTQEKPFKPISGKGVEIVQIDLREVKQGEYPYDSSNLYSLAIQGRDAVTKRRDRYALIFFYKDLAQIDRRTGWFAVNKLDRRGFAEPNALSLGEISSKRWTYHTSRLYIRRKSEPRLAFIAVILPNETLTKLSRKISNDENGWGKENLNFLRDLENIKISERFVFEAPRKP